MSFQGGSVNVCVLLVPALQPKLLILDEPTSALDVSIQQQILSYFKLQQQTGLAYIPFMI